MSASLRFASGEDTLSVRSFTVSEGLSTLFDVSVVALSPADSIDLESILGQAATLRLEGGTRGTRAWAGVCNHFEELQAEETGLSTYLVRIVPTLWLATQGQRCQVHQHLSVPEIAKAILGEWGIEPILRLDLAHYPRQEYRVQYGESDFTFLSRILEGAGITYFFVDHPEKGTSLVLADAPNKREARRGPPIPFVDQPNPGGNTSATTPYLTRVAIGRELRPGAFAVRDYDFERARDYALEAHAKHGAAVESKLEHYHYEPGSFVHEGHAPNHRAAHADDKEGAALAARRLEAERALREVLRFETNDLDLAPGTVFTMSGHPRGELGPPNAFLCFELATDGASDGEWTTRGRATPAKTAFRPSVKTPHPKVSGVQSAIVTGPKGEEIHTDEHGRVRIQFHWDRQGAHDDKSSCWVRVSQGWAGAGFGMMMIPRVGQEVTVGFFEGDPDHPIVIGRVYSAASRVPYKLPDHKTRSTWRSESTPGGGGHNEILLEDEKNAELVQIHAERDMHKIVRMNEIERIGGDRTVTVGHNRSITVGGQDTTLVGARHSIAVGSTSGSATTNVEMTDGKIVYTTGQATVTFSGPDIALEAKGNITIIAHDGDVVIRGGPNVKINSD